MALWCGEQRSIWQKPRSWKPKVKNASLLAHIARNFKKMKELSKGTFIHTVTFPIFWQLNGGHFKAVRNRSCLCRSIWTLRRCVWVGVVGTACLLAVSVCCPGTSTEFSNKLRLQKWSFTIVDRLSFLIKGLVASVSNFKQLRLTDIPARHDDRLAHIHLKDGILYHARDPMRPEVKCA